MNIRHQRNSVVCLMAPTASGKTALAYELYDTGYYELISVDSALIYRDMNIGTAKPTPAELQRYPHHLVDIIDPTDSYSVAEFVNDVEHLIEQSQQKGKIPLLVGGSMMYFMALFAGLSNVPDSDAQIRAQVDIWRQAEGNAALYDYLATVDPICHQRLKVSDTQRLTRAVEVYKQTGKPLSYWQAQPKKALACMGEQQWYGLAVMPDREWLHQRIAKRLIVMWQAGLVDEVVALLQKYTLTPDMPAMRSVGYRQVLEYLVAIQHPILQASHLNSDVFYQAFAEQHASIQSGSMTTKLACQQMQNKALYATRQLAKRQYTWLRKLVKLNKTNTHEILNDTLLNDDMSNKSINRQPILSRLSNNRPVSNQLPIIKAFTNIEQVKKYLK